MDLNPVVDPMDLTPGKLYLLTRAFVGGTEDALVCISAAPDGMQLRVRLPHRAEWLRPHQILLMGVVRDATDEDLLQMLTDWEGNGSPLTQFRPQANKVLPEEIDRVRTAWFRVLDRKIDLEMRLPSSYIPCDYARNWEDLENHTDAWRFLARGLLAIHADMFSVYSSYNILIEDGVELTLRGSHLRLRFFDSDAPDQEGTVFVARTGGHRSYPDGIGQIIASAPAPYRHLLDVVRRTIRLLASTGRSTSGNIPADKAMDALAKGVLVTALAQLSASYSEAPSQ